MRFAHTALAISTKTKKTEKRKYFGRRDRDIVFLLQPRRFCVFFALHIAICLRLWYNVTVVELKKKNEIDWVATGENLARLRTENIALRRYACLCNTVFGTRNTLAQWDEDKTPCDMNCRECRVENMDKNISRRELGNVFDVSENLINNWETGVSRPPLDDLLFYCELAGVELADVLVFKDRRQSDL